MAPGENGDEMQAQLLVSSDGTSLIYYIASNAGGLIASDEFKRPTAARNDSLPSELWENYIYDSGPERNGTLTVDAFRIDDNTYFNARQENGVWVVETGNGIEGWNERLSLLPDGRLSIQDDYSTEPTYYVRAVSYTHLDVYKRQSIPRLILFCQQCSYLVATLLTLRLISATA